MTAGIFFKSGSHIIGEIIFDEVKQQTREKVEAVWSKMNKAKATYHVNMNTADTVLLSKPAQSTKSVNPNWIIKDLQEILKPMKKKEDGVMPSKKPPLLMLYLRFVAENRMRVMFDESCDGLIMGEGSELVEVVDEVADDDDCGDVYQTQAI